MGAASLHLICGSTGAGNTTYARRLLDEISGVRFSNDEWMAALFWPDAPDPIDPAWAIARVERCRARIWATAVEVARRGTPCVLEIGLTMRAERARHHALTREAGLAARFHILDCPAEERWRRVERRNAEGELDFAITRAMFDFVETMWEPPTVQELAGYDAVRIAS